jgi:HEAT repeat protein
MPDAQKFLSDIQSDSADVRFAAWRAAGDTPPSVIPELGKLAGSPDPGKAKAAREALSAMVHSAGKDLSSPNRPAIVKGLLEVTGASYALPARVHAFRLLSVLAGEDSVPEIAKAIEEPQLREEAVYALERIPGSASIKALTAAYKNAPEDFKPRILAALGHRRAAEGVPLCLEAMRSPDKDLAVAGAKAFGRIGKKPAAPPRYPDLKALSEWQRIDQMDSTLRYADAQAREGNTAEALRVYKTALDRPEEHWQCAAIIGIAKLGTPEAATVIHPKLKSDNAKVRITAQKAWKGMA